MQIGVGSDTDREIPAEFGAVQGCLVDGEMRSVENVDDSGWEEKTYLRSRLEESKVDIVSDEDREIGDAANESGEFEDNL